MSRHFLRTFNRFFHQAQDVCTAFFGLFQSDVHDFFGDALDFDVHLQSSDAVFGTRYFKVHVAQVVFVAQDVGQYRKFRAFQNQAHGNTCHVCFQRHAS